MKRWAASQRGIRWTLGGVAAIGLAPAAAQVVLVPTGDWLAHQDGGPAGGPLSRMAWDTARGRVLALGAGLLATGALLFTVRRFALSRDGRVTDRYAKAREQLGCEKVDVRIGGIHALERIARDSPADPPAVMEMLAAFIRERSREQRPPPDPGRPGAATIVEPRRSCSHYRARVPGAPSATSGLLTSAARTSPARTSVAPGSPARTSPKRSSPMRSWPAADLPAARNRPRGPRLRGISVAPGSPARAGTCADLTGADLTDVDLTGADLADADLTRADLTGALWPAAGPVPVGWDRHTGSGQLIPASTGAETEQANQPHG